MAQPNSALTASFRSEGILALKVSIARSSNDADGGKVRRSVSFQRGAKWVEKIGNALLKTTILWP